MTEKAELIELKACPFCGKPPELKFNHQTDSGECWAVECADCDIDRWGEYQHSSISAQKSAAAAWNHRTTPPPISAADRIEVVARAIWETPVTGISGKRDHLRSWPPDSLDARDETIEQAKAAIAALSIPAEGELVEALREIGAMSPHVAKIHAPETARVALAKVKGNG